MESGGAPERLTDLELLEMREEMAMEDRPRFARVRGITIAATRDGQAHFVGGAVPDALAPVLV